MHFPRSLALPLAVFAAVSVPAAGAALAQALPAHPTSMPASHPGTASLDTWAVRLMPGSDPDAAAARAGARNLGQIARLPDTYLFHVVDGSTASQSVSERLRNVDGIVWQEQQIPRQRHLRAFTDPLFPNQWHLVRGTLASVDANVQPAWDLGADGTGIVIAVADTGVAVSHGDIAPNYRADLSWNFNGNNANPNDTHGHGTAAAGVAAAADDGVRCGVGAAYNAQIAGLRLIMAAVSDATEAEALAWNTDIIQISSNSWGPSDNGATVEGPGPLTRAAMEQAANEGRDGLGTIWVWAAGNGGTGDDSGADGYVSMRQTIGVAGVTSNGGRPGYGEGGSANLVAAPTDGGSRGITTTSLNNNCTNSFGGTSSAAPLVSGIVALMLDARPELSWRDVQHVLVETAVKVDANHANWIDNGVGRHFNDFYGFGMVDAGAAVELASEWTLVGPALESASAVRSPAVAIPQVAAGGGATDTVVVDSNIDAIEHAEVVFTATHQRRGEMEVTLVSPSSTATRLIRPRGNDSSGAGFSNWTFSANAFWGEDPNGTWTLRVRDASNNGNTGTWQNWQLIVHGTGAVEPVAEGTFDAATPFGDVIVGSTSTSQVLQLTSTGDLPLQLTASAALDDATQFTLDPGTCIADADLGTDGSCSVTVTFAPQATGAFATTLRIPTNAGEFTAALDGTGVAPAALFEGDTGFDPLRLGQSSPLHVYTLRSTGTAALVLDTAPQLLDGTHFVLEPGTCIEGLVLESSQSCTVGVRYVPTTAGSHATELQVDTNAGPFALELDGEASDARAQIAGAAAFGDRVVGTVAGGVTITVTSSGTSPLTITDAPTLADAAPFAIDTTDCTAGTVLAPGEACTIGLTFSPTAAGNAVTTLHIPSDAGNFMLSVTGNGVLLPEIFADGFEASAD